MKEIKLTRGKITLVDDEDYEWLNQYKWCYAGPGYAYRRTRNNEKPAPYTTVMHRQIMSFYGYDIDGLNIDHKNGNRLDNQKSNLRVATNNQNVFNQRKHKDNTSGYKGVSWSKDHKEWEVYITVNKRRIHLGYRENLEDAARLYDVAALKYFGEFSKLNFPDDKPKSLEIKPRNKIIHKNNSSGYRGVSYKKQSQKWVSEFQYNKQKIIIGLFETALEAAKAYNQIATQYLGERAKLNDIPTM